MTQIAVHLVVDDPDAAYDRGIAVGATAFRGERTAQCFDPSGHRRAVDRHLRDVSTGAPARRVAAMSA